jgi:hypothetical protein
MKSVLRRLVVAGVSALGVAAFVNSADANSIFAPNPPTVTPVGSNFRWDYDIVVSQGSEVQTGDAFTIYDFAGFVGVSGTLPTGWTLTSTNPNSPDYAFQTRATTDNPAITDLTVSYSGATTGSTSGNTSLGTFSFISTFGSRADSFFEDQDHTIFNGQAQTDNHNTQVPVGVPVPAALWGGLGLLGSLFTAKVIRRK